MNIARTLIASVFATAAFSAPAWADGTPLSDIINGLGVPQTTIPVTGKPTSDYPQAQFPVSGNDEGSGPGSGGGGSGVTTKHARPSLSAQDFLSIKASVAIASRKPVSPTATANPNAAAQKQLLNNLMQLLGSISPAGDGTVQTQQETQIRQALQALKDAGYDFPPDVPDPSGYLPPDDTADTGNGDNGIYSLLPDNGGDGGGATVGDTQAALDALKNSLDPNTGGDLSDGGGSSVSLEPIYAHGIAPPGTNGSKTVPIASTQAPGPTKVVTAPSTQVAAPSTQVAGPSSIGTAPSTQVKGPSSIATVPTTQVAGPSSAMTAPSTQVTGPSSVMTGPSNQITGPSTQLVTNAGTEDPSLCGR
jgi:hypothetical protein